MNQSAEFLRKHHRLTTRSATGIDDDTKLLFWKKAQNMPGMGVAAWAELFHAAEEQADWIVDVHVLPDCSARNVRASTAGRGSAHATHPRTGVV